MTIRNLFAGLLLAVSTLIWSASARAAPVVATSLASPLVCPSTLPQPRYFVRRNGYRPTYNGAVATYRGFTFYPADIGAHTAWLSSAFKTYIDQRVFRDAAALGDNLLRPLYQIDQQSPTGWGNPTVWANMDYLICNAAAHGDGVILDLTFMKDVLAKQGKTVLDPANWYGLIDMLAPHYRNATSIVQVNFYSEPPHSRSASDVATLTAFYRAVMARWYAHDPNHLMTPGGLGQLEDGYAGWWQAVYALPHTSLIGFEAYSMLDLNYQPTVVAFARAHHLLLYFNEFGEPNYVGDATYTGQQWDGITMSRSAFFRRVYSDAVRYGYGMSIFWNVGCQTHSGAFDVNAATSPATITAVRAYAPRTPVGTLYC